MDAMTNYLELYSPDAHEKVHCDAREFLAFLTHREASDITDWEFLTWFFRHVEEGAFEAGIQFHPFYEAGSIIRESVPVGYGLTTEGMQAILTYTVKVQEEAFSEKLEADRVRFLKEVGHE